MSKGLSQRSGIDHGELYGPVARYSTLRVFLSTAVQNRSGLPQLDVRASFINGPLREKLYIEHLEGYVQNVIKFQVLPLRKALYGLKQAARAFLGISVVRSGERMDVSNSTLIEYITQRFFSAEAKTTPTAIATETRIDRNEESPVTEAPYHELIWTLLYFANTVRPDISLTVGRVPRFYSDPREVHWTETKRVVRYFKGTRAMGIEYGEDNEEIIDYSDSDFAGYLEELKSTTGFLFK